MTQERPAVPCGAPMPASAGIGLRAEHYKDVDAERPVLGFLEVHSENYFGDGGLPHYYLSKLRADYPISFHGVGMSIGTTDKLDAEHLTSLKNLIARYEPGLVSEHLSWSSVAGRFYNDLLPLPYTEESLAHLCAQVNYVQEFLSRTILLENASTYLEYAESTIPEWEFISSLAKQTGCGILLDVNNVFVSARNHGFDAAEYIRKIDGQHIGEVHLAGHTVKTIGDTELRIDTHDCLVCDEVWELYTATLQRLGPKPTLIEWDTDLPPLSVLLGEAATAQTMLRQHHARAA